MFLMKSSSDRINIYGESRGRIDQDAESTVCIVSKNPDIKTTVITSEKEAIFHAMVNVFNHIMQRRSIRSLELVDLKEQEQKKERPLWPINKR
jgi:hypothetical protein